MTLGEEVINAIKAPFATLQYEEKSRPSVIAATWLTLGLIVGRIF